MFDWQQPGEGCSCTVSKLNSSASAECYSCPLGHHSLGSALAVTGLLRKCSGKHHLRVSARSHRGVIEVCPLSASPYSTSLITPGHFIARPHLTCADIWVAREFGGGKFMSRPPFLSDAKSAAAMAKGELQPCLWQVYRCRSQG